MTIIGSKFVDLAFIRPGGQAIRRAGYVGVARYSSFVNRLTKGKIITASEYQDYIANRLDVLAIYEWYEGRCREGYQAGVEDGQIALSQWKAVGHPQGCKVYFNDDTGSSYVNPIADYLRGCNDAMGGYYTADLYANGDVIRTCLNRKLIAYGWHAMPRGWPGYNPRIAGLWQTGSQDFNGGADVNIVQASFLGTRNDVLNSANIPPLDWFDMATQADLENAVRKVLNEGTAKGQQNWATTNQAILGTVQHNTNLLNQSHNEHDNILTAIEEGEPPE
jgi:hypothetical protein